MTGQYKSTGYFEQVPSPDLAEDLLRKYYKPGFKLLDIGCGLGNILKLANSIGYESTGIEINENLKKHHVGLNVIYGDVLEMNLSFIKNFDIIYLYRPIADNNKANLLFKKIHENCKKGCKIIYLLPHNLELNLKRKFKYELFSNRIYDDKKGDWVYSDDKYEKGWDSKDQQSFSVLNPLKNIKNDIDIRKMLDDTIKKLLKFRTYNGDRKERFGSSFACTKIKDLEYFLNYLDELYDNLNEHNISIKMNYSIEVKNIDDNIYKNPHIYDKTQIRNHLNLLKKHGLIFKKLKVNILYTDFKGNVYKQIPYF